MAAVEPAKFDWNALFSKFYIEISFWELIISNEWGFIFLLQVRSIYSITDSETS